MKEYYFYYQLILILTIWINYVLQFKIINNINQILPISIKIKI